MSRRNSLRTRESKRRKLESADEEATVEILEIPKQEKKKTMKRIVLKLKRGVPLIDLGTDLVEAKFLRRPSRRNRSPYVADVSIVDPATSNSGREAIAHAPAMDLGGKYFEGVPMILRLARDRKGNLVGPNAVSKKYGTPRCELITQLVRCEEAENAKLGGTWIGAHPSIGEKVVHFMLQNDMIKEVPDIVKVEREVRNICGANMRTDFVVTSRSGRRTVVEVKTVVDTDYDSSLRDSVDEKCDNARGSHAKKKGSNKSKCVFYGSTKPYQRCAIFPWGRARQKGPEGEVVVSARAIKHVRELSEIARGRLRAPNDERLDAAIIFVVVRSDAVAFRPNADACPSFARFLREAKVAGVKIICHSVDWTTGGSEGTIPGVGCWNGQLPVFL